MSTLQTTNIKNPSSASNNIVLDSSARVGINTATPGTTLDVAGNQRFSAANPVIELNNGGPQVYSPSANTLCFASGGGIGTPTETARIDSSGNLRFNSGYGSVATAYGCRAWANFNGGGTVAIRASGNVSSITDNGVGDYTVNFTTAMPDANYSWSGSAQDTNTSGTGLIGTWVRSGVSPTTSALRIYVGYQAGTLDSTIISVAVFR